VRSLSIAIALMVFFSVAAAEKKTNRRAFTMPKKAAPEAKAPEPAAPAPHRTDDGGVAPAAAPTESVEAIVAPPAAEARETVTPAPVSAAQPAASPSVKPAVAMPFRFPARSRKPAARETSAQSKPESAQNAERGTQSPGAFTLPGQKPPAPAKRNPATFRLPEKKKEEKQ
jgi:hypothetical protein